MNFEKGQSLIELIIVIGIFVIVVSASAFLFLNSYEAGRLGLETTKANLLVQEGIEAARSIRSNDWQGLTNGDHGLAIFGGQWQFSGTFELIDNKFTRIIVIEELDSNRKKITSKINWQFTEAKPQELSLITYLTNWQQVSVNYCTGTPTPCQGFSQTGCPNQDGCFWADPACGGTCTPCEGLNRGQCNHQDGCSWDSQQRQCVGVCTSCDNFIDQGSCQDQSGCQWNPAQCAGVPAPCESYNTEIECLDQDGCQWIIP